MSDQDQRDLLNLLTGELPPAAARTLQMRLEQEPELAAAYRRLETTWSGLELRPPVGAPVGFAGRLASLAAQTPRSPRDSGLALGLRWLPAAAALVVGIGIGVELGDRLLTEPTLGQVAVAPSSAVVTPPAPVVTAPVDVVPAVAEPVATPAVNAPRPAPVPSRPRVPAAAPVAQADLADYDGLFASEGLGDAYWEAFGEGEGAPR